MINSFAGAAGDKNAVTEIMRLGIEQLRAEDAELFELLERETLRQSNVLAMVAASSIADPSVLVCEGMACMNVTTEGYPAARYHAGCEVVDDIERLAIERAKAAFGAQYANVQPHSGSSANGVVIFSLLEPGDTLLGMDLDAGGHLTHGSKASVVGQYFDAVGYGVTEEGRIDYDQVGDLARRHRPKLIICGASAYPRIIEFARFREIADEVDAYLLADISHIAGLVAGGVHPSPIDHAHLTTTSTYKQLYGPRGGLILSGRDADGPAPRGKGTLADAMQRGVFPYFQGTPNLSAIAAKTRALARVVTPEFSELAQNIVADARALASCLTAQGFQVLTGGTENHTVLINVLQRGITGVIAERSLEQCGIIVNKNRIPGDRKSAQVTSGVRFGTNSLALRGITPNEMPHCSALINQVLTNVHVLDDRQYELNDTVRRSVRASVEAICQQFPIPGFPTAPRQKRACTAVHSSTVSAADAKITGGAEPHE
jgi:glycine hydroxymethyltransferase